MVALNTYFGSPNLGLDAAREAVRIARKGSDSDLLLHALNRLIVALLFRGTLHASEGVGAIREAESLLGTCGDLILKFFVRLNQAVWHLEVGEVHSAEQAFAAAEKYLPGNRAPDAQARLQLNLGELYLVSGDPDRARDSYKKARSLITRASPHYFSALATAGMGLCDLTVGNLARARKAEMEMPALPEFWTFDPFIMASFKAKMFLKRQDPTRAFSLLGSIRIAIKDRLVPAWLRLTHEEARLQKTRDAHAALQVAQEGSKTAVSLNLTEQMRRFEREIESIRRYN
jgi:tetratricopeptide (TPR) repeat protein